MTYDPASRQLDLNNRPAFIFTDPATMTSAVAMLHHRISWNTLGTALNGVLAGAVDRQVVNYLLRMSPDNSFAVINGFTTALTRVLANQALTPAQVSAIDTVEQLVFTLPSNLFLGLNNRADDPGNGMDFLSGDVNPDGTLPRPNGQITLLGQLEQKREMLFNRLRNPPAPGALSDMNIICASIVQLWAAQTPAVGGAAPLPSLAQATGFSPAMWAPGVAPFANPAYRSWPGPLTAAQSAALNVVVMNRVNSLN